MGTTPQYLERYRWLHHEAQHLRNANASGRPPQSLGITPGFRNSTEGRGPAPPRVGPGETHRRAAAGLPHRVFDEIDPADSCYWNFVSITAADMMQKLSPAGTLWRTSR